MRTTISGRVGVGVASVALAAQTALAVSSVNLQFDGSGNTLAASGFQAAYSLTPSGFNVTGGRLELQTLPGDTFGDYENDPDTADNMFYTEITPYGRTVVEARVRVSDLNVNFHGGGIWMGTDQDHYIRTGLVNNTFEGGISFESLRENEDRWPGATIPGPGNDIDNRQFGLAGLSSPLIEPVEVILRIVRNGNNARTAVSLDNGATFIPAGGPTLNYTFDGIATGPTDPGVSGVGNTVEGAFKVGVHAFGGPDGSIPATFAYDSFIADSYLQGDFDSSKTVDIDDFGILAANFNTPGVWGTGDANENGTVDIDDFGLLASNFNLVATGGLARGSAVPEPATLGVLSLGWMAVRRRR